MEVISNNFSYRIDFSIINGNNIKNIHLTFFNFKKKFVDENYNPLSNFGYITGLKLFSFFILLNVAQFDENTWLKIIFQYRAACALVSEIKFKLYV